jgi:hypothetical protein
MLIMSVFYTKNSRATHYRLEAYLEVDFGVVFGDNSGCQDEGELRGALKHYKNADFYNLQLQF